MMQESFITSYSDLFAVEVNGTQIEQIEVPIIQRDYAQGRSDASASQIRNSFIEALYNAIVHDQPINLDFVYGDLNGGTLKPLDGQQRLTTLFLLHWYLASCVGSLSPEKKWTRFRYCTRPTAERFCQLLCLHAFVGPEPVSRWLKDQTWYLHTWDHDPTVQSMLRMLDAIQARFAGADLQQAWDRLTDTTRPAVSFHVLPLISGSEDSALYIKMNSRGKPLTVFENFKAKLEQIIYRLPSASVFARKIDTAWSDLFWKYRGPNNIVDDEMFNYLDFIMEIAWWRQEKLVQEDAFRLAEQLFGPAAGRAAESTLGWLTLSFDIWVDVDIDAYFKSHLRSNKQDTAEGLPIFREEVDLFKQCCSSYHRNGRNRSFGWPETLLFYAFIFHRMHKTTDFERRLRVLRNLIEASPNELRLENMPGLIHDVEKLFRESSIEDALKLETFYSGQVEHEKDKIAAVGRNPVILESLFDLEDHNLLRGSVVAFDLYEDVAIFVDRAAKFESCFSDKNMWPLMTAALLAIGNYSRLKGSRFYFGSGKDNVTSWREVFARGSSDDLKQTRRVLASLLDRLPGAATDLEGELQNIVASYLSDSPTKTGYDWRWYLVKYDVMRDGNSGIYVSSDREMSYGLCMLDKTQLNSNYRDPYLSAIIKEAGAPGNSVRDRFYGYAHNPRSMVLVKSGTKIQCVSEGYRVIPTEDPELHRKYLDIVIKYGLANDTLSILKMPTNNSKDAVDRIELGGNFLRELLAAGL